VDSVVNSILGKFFPTGQAPSNMPSFGTAPTPDGAPNMPSFGAGMPPRADNPLSGLIQNPRVIFDSIYPTGDFSMGLDGRPMGMGGSILAPPGLPYDLDYKQRAAAIAPIGTWPDPGPPPPETKYDI